MSKETNEKNFLVFTKDKFLAQEFAKEIKAIDSSFKVHYCAQFNQFVEMMNTIKVDFFALDYHLEEVPATDLAEKLRQGLKYHRTVIAFLGNEKDKISKEQFSRLNIQHIFKSMDQIQLKKDSILESLKISRKKLIPDSYKVLVLDNNPDILDLMSGFLENIQHENFSCAKSIAESKELITEEDFDIFLLDWNLDDGSCFDLIEYIKKQSGRNRLQNALIMVITGRSEIDDMLTLLRFNVKHSIIKPFDFHEFEEKLEFAVKSHFKNL